VTQMIERGVALFGRYLHRTMLAHFGEQGSGVIGDAGAGGRQGRIESEGHSLDRFPNSAVPTRTQVEPSSMAVTRSLLMPIERPRSSYSSASSRRRRKQPRGASGSSLHGGMVISPVSCKLGQSRMAAIKSG